MKIEVHCSRCGKGYLLDEAFAGTALPCPACGEAGGLRVEPPAAAPPSPAPVTPAGAAAPAPEEVVCPRCKLHFVPRRATAEAEAGVRPTVLLVQEPSYFREIAQEALASRFELRLASTLAEAEQALRAGGSDLVILDPRLEGGAGAELLRRLGPRPGPILLYTSQDETEMYGGNWEQLQALGADDIVFAGMQAGESLARKAAALLGRPLDEES